MASPEELTVHTVPSKWIGYGHHLNDSPNLEPYRRVVGVASPDGNITWARGRKSDGSPVDRGSLYTSEDTQEIELPFSDELAGRLTRYFEWYLTDPMRDSYNCHSFGFWMEGRRGGNPDIGYRLAALAAERQIVKGDPYLAVGQHAIIGNTNPFDCDPPAYHSVVGLGEDRDECIQIMGPLGHLGITSMAALAHRFSEDYQTLYLTRHPS